MNIYELQNWMNKEYNYNLFRKDIIEKTFNNLLIKIKNTGLIIKNEEIFYKNFLIYLYKNSN